VARSQRQFRLAPELRLQISQDWSRDSYRQWSTGVMLSYRVKRLLIPRPRDNDEENHHTPIIIGGYEYLRTSQNGRIKNETEIVWRQPPVSPDRALSVE
jgi:hypothetical protein